MPIVIPRSTPKSNNRTYTDIKLDLKTQFRVSGGVNLTKVAAGNDIEISVDEQAISNSLFNLFSAKPGDYPLSPQYGANLEQYLFEPISESNGEIIAHDIDSAIARWEPRVTVKSILAIADIDNSEYRFVIALGLPTLSRQEYTFTTALSRDHGISISRN